MSNMYGSYEKLLENGLLAAFSEGNNYNQEPISRSLYVPYWDLVGVDPFPWDPLCSNTQIDNQRRAMTMDALLYLPNWEAVTLKTSQLTKERKKKETGFLLNGS